MITTKLNIQDKLPLTCTRTGTCCHGKQVFLNPWELACLAREKQLTPREFRDQYCNFGGILLRFNGVKNNRGIAACSQYVENFGCSVHVGRPLACRLFPLGRQIQNEVAEYIYEGTIFPCLDECPEVVNLPQMSVGDYLKGQLTDSFEKAQDTYLDLMQNLADTAFALLLDTSLAASGETKTLATWRKIGNEQATELVERIGNDWIELLILPTIAVPLEDSSAFIEAHNEQLQTKAQEKFGALNTNQEFHEASVLMMAITLYLARALGANPTILAEHWVEVAKSHGACE